MGHSCNLSPTPTHWYSPVFFSTLYVFSPRAVPPVPRKRAENRLRAPLLRWPCDREICSTVDWNKVHTGLLPTPHIGRNGVNKEVKWRVSLPGDYHLPIMDWSNPVIHTPNEDVGDSRDGGGRDDEEEHDDDSHNFKSINGGVTTWSSCFVFQVRLPATVAGG